MPTAAARKPATRAQRNTQALQRARTAHSTKTARPAPATPRRKSGPVRKPVQKRAVAKPVLARGATVVLDNVLRGRAWVFVVGVLLAGIVFLNVSVLELNRGIASTSAKTDKLERKNSKLRGRVAQLDSAERIQRLAEARGYVLPQPGDVIYLKPHRARDARLAAVRIPPPADETTTPEPVAPEPVAPEPVAAEPVATDPVVATPAATVTPATP